MLLDAVLALDLSTLRMKDARFVPIRVQNSDNKMRNYALFHFDIMRERIILEVLVAIKIYKY